MDAETLRYYQLNAAPVVARYEAVDSPVASRFPLSFPPGSRVLDIGSGSGRDLAALLNENFDARGVEPVAEMRQEALMAHPELAGRLEDASLPGLVTEAADSFDGVLCSAVLMHLPEQQLFDAAYNIRRVLKQHGRLLLSIPLVRTDVNQAGRDGNGRLFSPVGPDDLQLLFERLGFQQIGRWDTEDDDACRVSVKTYA